MNIIVLTPWDLVLAASLVLGLALVTLTMQLGIGKRLVIAALRTTIQLLLIGYVLNVLFAYAKLQWVLLMSLFMLLVAGREAWVRQKRPLSGWWGFGVGTFSIFISSFAVTLLTLLTIVSPKPWYLPQYSIPLFGMLLGNAMTAVSLTLDRLTQFAWDQRAIIEQRLMLGQDSHEVFFDYRKECLRMGLTPIINTMVAAGIIHLPGMMTGQLLAGNTPIEAAKYQILILFLIATGTGLGALVSVAIASRRLFDHRHRLRLDHVVQ